MFDRKSEILKFKLKNMCLRLVFRGFIDTILINFCIYFCMNVDALCIRDRDYMSIISVHVRSGQEE